MPGPLYIKTLPKTDQANEAVAGVMSVMCNVSVPMGISTPDQPNISTTLWRSVSDQQHRRYFFELTHLPNTFWVSMDQLDLSAGAPVKKLPLTERQLYAGKRRTSLCRPRRSPSCQPRQGPDEAL